MRKILILAAAALFAGPAGAATFAGSTPGPDSSAPTGLLTIDFESANLLSDIQGLAGNGQIVSGFLSGQYAAPFGNLTKYLSVPQSGSGGSATLNLTGYNFGGVVDGFSFYWGSIDTYNRLVVNTTLNGNAQTLNFAFDGSNPPPPADGSQQSAANNRRVYFNLAQGETLNSIEFVSNGYAFELDDIVFTGTAVPEPATWAMMIAGFGFVGASMRARRRSGRASVQAA